VHKAAAHDPPIIGDLDAEQPTFRSVAKPMPFPQQDAHPYTQVGIESIKPTQKGVYGLFQKSAWVYIGRAQDLRKRLLEHLHSDGSANPDKCIQQ